MRADIRGGRTAGLALVSCAVACILVALGCAGRRPAPVADWDGLVRQPGSRLGAVWLKPDADLAAYRSVLLDPLQVSFARDWAPNRRSRGSLGARNAQAIEDNLATLFREVFRAELASGGYALVDAPGPDTLRVTPAVIDLYVTAPDAATTGRTRVYTANAGRMTLVLEARDSESGELLARAIDTQSGRRAGDLAIANRTTNTADARRVIAIWARALRAGLDGLRAGPPAAARLRQDVMPSGMS